eukprot:CAMPEP_0177549848 /NCGR_PEP_ID=MMETSP0369-20130122/65249_1 /TAXON_ID=447022 ORGANISM="Scrippsiella hangoei-like, Strain SHHI-4" /NCGR_SAMPLE_ID=MMETSP0369 /ASSEMBLY_ACC=CAM_ASM_000364 /LENGTH=37 /DNA_ID= /DNA_START= /DNA_END= /DNA_ORIENTATION=
MSCSNSSIASWILAHSSRMLFNLGCWSTTAGSWEFAR